MPPFSRRACSARSWGSVNHRRATWHTQRNRDRDRFGRSIRTDTKGGCATWHTPEIVSEGRGGSERKKGGVPRGTPRKPVPKKDGSTTHREVVPRGTPPFSPLNPSQPP